jgi:hypothetical protein
MHLSCFLLPIAIYNSRIDRLKVSIRLLVSLLFRSKTSPPPHPPPQFVLNSYCARLSGLSPPLVSFSGWTRPLGKQFLIAFNSKVKCVCDGSSLNLVQRQGGAGKFGI